MQIDIDLLKQCRETADWFLKLPEKLVTAVMGPREIYLDRRERIQKAKELAALREVGKIIQNLYLVKGNIFVALNEMQYQKDAGAVEYVRDLFMGAAEALGDICSVVSEIPLSSAQLGAEVSLEIAKAKKTYEALGDLPEEAILDDRRLLDILACLDEMRQTGDFLLRMLDGHRQHLDNTRD
jgi:hypothetical protein